MDSGNSGSMSSSGDEEYESRTESIPSFNLNPSSSTHHFNIGSSSESNPSDPSLLSHHLFDLSPSNYLQPNSSSNPNFLLNLDTTTSAALRSRSGLRSDHHLHHHHQHQSYQLGPLSSSSSPSAHQSALASHQYAGPSAIHLQQPETNAGAFRSGTTASSTTTTSTTSAQTTVVGRSSKKRTRASRRAPTTVLTTDTSNFRAMVQEFTGIPAPPFSGSSLTFSRRLDLFGSGSALGRSGGGHLEGPLYPLRPSAQKPQTSPFGNIASSSSSSSPLFSNVMMDATNIASSSLNFQPSSSDHHHRHHHQGLMISKQPRSMALNMQNPGMNMAFQSLPLHPNSLNMAGFGEKQGQGSNLAMCTTTSALIDHQELNAGFHRGGINSNQVASDIWRVDGPGSTDSCKLNYAAGAAANSSEFQAEKGTLEINVSARNEGTVDPWIFPSD